MRSFAFMSALGLLGGCTQPEPAAAAPSNEELVAAAEKIDAAADKLQTAAADLNAASQALAAMRAEDAKAREEARAQPAPPRPAPPPVGEGGGLDPAAEEAIECATEGKCTIKRAYLDALIADPATTARQARIVPSQKDGAVHGFKVFGIRRGSVPALLGFINGDTIVRVGDRDLTSVDAAMEVFLELRTADRLVVEFLRRGERLILEIATAD